MYSILLLSARAMLLQNVELIVMFMVIILLSCVPYLRTPHSHKVFYHSYWVCMDKLSAILVVLTVWITILMCLAMYKAPSKNNLLLRFTRLNFILVLGFLSKNLLGFFIFFELSLVPTLYIILGWGIQPERIRAGRYLIIYTLLGALPLLGALIYADYHRGGVKLYTPAIKKICFFRNKDYSLFCILWILAFLIKLPIYGVHLWLPKAHVEAPVAGSMVLAGILLKLGAYGLIRSLHFLKIDLCFWRNILFFWSIITMCLVGFICFRQCDLKSLVAYSSVAHMSLILRACFSGDLIGIKGAMAMLVSHGLCSSGLFFAVQTLYEKRGSRNILINRGWISISPMFTFFWFILCVGNASAPPRLNILSEFLLISSIVEYGQIMGALFCGFSVFLGGLFRIYLYVSVCHGKFLKRRNCWRHLRLRNAFILLLHILPLYGLLFLSKYFFYVCLESKL